MKTLKGVFLILQKDKLPGSTSSGLTNVHTHRHLQKSELMTSFIPVPEAKGGL